jgi:tRNA G26 N,N-dimethylase Trm1
MFKIICKDFARADAFKKGGSEWDEGIDKIDEIVKKHDVEYGAKDLFYSLLKEGEASTVSMTRADTVIRALTSEGYNAYFKTGDFE